jgi:hypothetical protein
VPLIVTRHDIGDSMSKQLGSAAYHEAGHMTAAVVQGMPVRAKGLHTDLYGNGVSYYFDRPDTDLGMTPLDLKQRKLTIIALYAAHAAQVKFYSACEQTGWQKDLTRIRTQSDQMHPTDESARIAMLGDLRERAGRVIEVHWKIVEELGEALLAKPSTPMSPEEIREGWGIGPLEHHMNGYEIVEFFNKHGIRAKVVSDNVTSYDSTQDIPHYDSLA